VVAPAGGEDSRASAAVGGRGSPDGDGLTLGGVSIDSRRIGHGDLFVAIRAERDGHHFVDAAIEAGAGAVLVDERWFEDRQPGGGAGRGSGGGAGRGSGAAVPVVVPVVVVADTSRALLDVGRAARDRLDVPVVGITGSVGKTSTKDLTAAALSAGLRAVGSEKSFNNELGVPLTLANAPESTEVAVLEMGSRGRGHIARLCQVARPTIGVVTAVAAAHTDSFGSLDGVAAAKGELVEALPPTGTAVLNGDDPRVSAMAARTDADVVTYSAATPPVSTATVVAERVRLDEQLRPSFFLRSPWGSMDVRLEARGRHQVGNALAALAVAGRCGVDLGAAAVAVSTAAMSPWRMQLGRAAGGATVLNDAYNANPASMAAALHALAALPAARKVAVLGVMAELGPDGDRDHLGVAGLARDLEVELVAVGTPAYGVEPVAGIEEAARALGPLGPTDAVLIKASRVAGLERLAARLLER
jgi:UDP-N-acetylmuramoyl-tripeptide--D-alanyl-D-alanine ligase